jgi:channel protein (hemolysin III family)
MRKNLCTIAQRADPVVRRNGMEADPIMTGSAKSIQELYQLPYFHEPFSAISHLLGAVIFVVLGGMLLWRGRGDRARLAFLAVYAYSCVLLFSMSGVYHMMVRGSIARLVFERLDHSAIFILVAGTFTPAHGLLFRGWLRWGPLILIWAAAVTGITLKTIFFEDFAPWVGLSIYLTLGWFGLFSGILVAHRYGFAFVQPLLWGGVAYSVGAIMEFRGWLVLVPGIIHAHELFHLAVLAGALLHWRFVWQFASGPHRYDTIAPDTPRLSGAT